MDIEGQRLLRASPPQVDRPPVIPEVMAEAREDGQGYGEFTRAQFIDLVARLQDQNGALEAIVADMVDQRHGTIARIMEGVQALQPQENLPNPLNEVERNVEGRQFSRADTFVRQDINRLWGLSKHFYTHCGSNIQTRVFISNQTQWPLSLSGSSSIRGGLNISPPDTIEPGQTGYFHYKRSRAWLVKPSYTGCKAQFVYIVEREEDPLSVGIAFNVPTIGKVRVGGFIDTFSQGVLPANDLGEAATALVSNAGTSHNTTNASPPSMMLRAQGVYVCAKITHEDFSTLIVSISERRVEIRMPPVTKNLSDEHRFF